MTLVSVIIPTFNRAEMLRGALESVLSQSWRDFELIVVDDGSSDETRALLESYRGRLTAIFTSRHGVAAARNLGARKSSGRWLAFLDSDDLWLPEKLELQLNALRGRPECWFCHTDEVWVRRGRRVNPKNKHAKRGGRIFEWCLPMCRISPSSSVIDSRLFARLGGFDTSFRVCEDYEFWLRLTAAEPVVYLDRQLIVKRGGHDDQLSRSHWGFDRWRVRALRKTLDNVALDRGQKRSTLRELMHKAAILENGYAKRGKRLMTLRYSRIIAAARDEMSMLECAGRDREGSE